MLNQLYPFEILAPFRNWFSPKLCLCKPLGIFPKREQMKILITTIVLLMILVAGLLTPQFNNAYAATSVQFMVLPFNDKSVLVQEGWKAHFSGFYKNDIHGAID